MEKIKELDGKLVMLVKVPTMLPLLEAPHVGDYDNRYILQTTPCVKYTDGKYTDVRYGKPVKKDADTLEWNLMTGNVLQYPDGTNILLSRSYANGKILCLNIGMRDEFHEETMIKRPLISRVVKVRR